MEQTFKILKYGRIFVDPNMLYKGIYESKTPALYPIELTIEKLTQQYNDMSKLHGLDFDVSTVIENLSKCTLQEVKLIELS